MDARARILPPLVLLLVVLAAQPAHAALWMEFEPSKGYPGTRVEGRTMGEGALTNGPGRAFPAWLDPFDRKERIPIGHVVVDADGNGTLKFEVPDVPGGKYTVIMSCKPCAPYSAGATEAHLGEFRVLGPPAPPPPESSQRDGSFPGIAALTVVCLLLGAFVLRRLRLKGTNAPSGVAEPR